MKKYLMVAMVVMVVMCGFTAYSATSNLADDSVEFEFHIETPTIPHEAPKETPKETPEVPKETPKETSKETPEQPKETPEVPTETIPQTPKETTPSKPVSGNIPPVKPKKLTPIVESTQETTVEAPVEIEVVDNAPQQEPVEVEVVDNAIPRTGIELGTIFKAVFFAMIMATGVLFILPNVMKRN